MTDRPIGENEVATRVAFHIGDQALRANIHITEYAAAAILANAPEIAADLIRTLDAAREAKGFVVAPHLATDNMAETGVLIHRSVPPTSDVTAVMKAIYQNMLAAAPAPTEEG